MHKGEKVMPLSVHTYILGFPLGTHSNTSYKKLGPICKCLFILYLMWLVFSIHFKI